MQTVRPDSENIRAVNELKDVAPKITEHHCCCCTNVAALAIIASLATFVFFPFCTAFAITSVVTIGAIYLSGTETVNEPDVKGAEPEKKSAVNKAHLPNQIVMLEFGGVTNQVQVMFPSVLARANFTTNYKEKFVSYASVANEGQKSVVISLEVSGWTVGKIIDDLSAIFGGDAIEKALQKSL